jgi:hypothetical protein
MTVTRAIALGVAAALLAGPAATAQQARQPSLTFDEDAISLSAKELSEGKAVTVINERAKDLRASFRLSDLGLRSTEPPLDRSTAGAIKLDPVDVPAGGERKVTIRSDVPLEPGLYEGRLSVYNEATDSVARIPISIDLRPKEETAPKTPVVKSLKGLATAIAPWAGADATVELPIDVRKGSPTLKAGTSVGALSGEDGRVAEVTLDDGKVEAATPGLATTTLKIQDLDRAGTYSGTIDLTPDDDKGAVELSVDVRDSILWAIAFLAIGIFVALRGRRWKGMRAGYTIEGRRTAADVGFNEAWTAFQAAAAEKPWKDYDARGPYHVASKKVRAAVADLANASFEELDEDARKLVEAQIETLEQAVESVAKLSVAFESLEEALHGLAIGRPDWLPGPATPAFATAARNLLTGTDHEGKPRELSLAAIDTLLDDVAKASVLAERWPLLHAEAVRAARRVGRGSVAADESDDVVLAARRKLIGAWLLLAEAPDVETVEERNLLAHFGEAIAAAAELSRPARVAEGPPDALAGVTDDVDEKAEAEERGVLLGGLHDLPSDPQQRLAEIGRRVRVGDTVVVVGAAALALYSGLEALYIDKTFGTFEDYLAAALWGLVTAGALDALGQALQTRLSSLVPPRG